MGTRVELPEGAWAELYDPRKVPERRRRGYILAVTEFQRAVAALPLDAQGEPDNRMYGPEQQLAMDGLLDQLILALVASWSLDVEIAAVTLADLPADTYDALRVACMALRDELTPNYQVDPDPKSAYHRLYTLAYGLTAGGVDIHDPTVRRYLLTHEFHMGWADQDAAPAVELDDLLMLHAHIRELTAE